jgi:putative hydrolase of the HAD superfamily
MSTPRGSSDHGAENARVAVVRYRQLYALVRRAARSSCANASYSRKHGACAGYPVPTLRGARRIAQAALDGRLAASVWSPTMQTVSFDLDGVLIRNPFELGVEPYVVGLIAHGSSSLHALPPEGREEAVRAEIGRAFVRRLRRNPISAYDWDAVYGEVSCAFEGPAHLPDVAGLVRHFVAAPDTIALLPGAAEALARVHDAGFRCVALTNGYSSFQRPALEALGVADAFEDVISPLETGCTKPDGRMFAAVRGLVAHVGDTLWHDVLGARRAGVAAIWSHAAGPQGATTERWALAATSATVAGREPHRLLYPDVATVDLVPDVGGRRPDEVVRVWLERFTSASRR